MRDEDLDWKLYWALERCGSATVGELLALTGAEPERLEGSINRLEMNLLLEKKEDNIRLLSVNESILKCQMKYSFGSMLSIENGVIKIKKENE